MVASVPMQTIFGAGSLWAVNQSVSNPTPIRLGITQDISIDFSRSVKTLVGQNSLPFGAAPGVITTKGKVSHGQINGRQLNDLFFAGNASVAGSAIGQTLITDNEAQTAATNVTVTNTPFKEDLGVVYNSTGLPFINVAAGPTVGQYTVNGGGTYGFGSADSGVAVNISYAYTTTSAGTQTFTLSQQPMGSVNTFQAVMNTVYNSKQANIILNACIASKIGLATKLEDFMKPDFEFEAFADSSGTLGKIIVTQS
jgi:hypothetical protein